MKNIAFIHAGMSFESYLGSYLYDEVYRGIREACRERGMICRSYDRRSSLARLAGKFDGYIGIIPSHSDMYVPWKRIGKDHPSVSMMMATKAAHANLVATDDRAILAMLIEHLRAQGHTRIGYMGAARESYSYERFNAYRDYLRARGMPIEQAWVKGFSLRTGRSTGTHFDRPYSARPLISVDMRLSHMFASLVGNDRPSAMIFETDYLALSFITFAQKSGIRVPEDIAVAGIDDNRGLFPRYRNVMLTTAAQDFFAIGNAAAVLLSDLIDTNVAPGQTVLIPPSLVIRRSTARKSMAAGKDDAAFRHSVLSRLEALYRERKPGRRISRELGLNHKYFLSKFAALFGVSFVDYLAELRLDRAAGMLRETSEQVVAIAFSVGFTSHQHFGRAFKRRFRCSPAVYRRKRSMAKSSVLRMAKS